MFPQRIHLNHPMRLEEFPGCEKIMDNIASAVHENMRLGTSCNLVKISYEAAKLLGMAYRTMEDDDNAKLTSIFVLGQPFALRVGRQLVGDSVVVEYNHKLAARLAQIDSSIASNENLKAQISMLENTMYALLEEHIDETKLGLHPACPCSVCSKCRDVLHGLENLRQHYMYEAFENFDQEEK